MIITTNFGHGFVGANNYYTQEEKLGRMETRQLPIGESQMHARYMQLTAMEAEQVEKPCLTLSISWEPSDEVSDDQMFETAHELMEHLGLEEHQYMVYQHVDQDHPHLHIMANTVHPDTEKARNLSREKSIAKQLDEFARPRELANGWTFVPGNHTPQHLLDRAGVEPYQQENIKVRVNKTGANKVLFNAESWEQMHRGLAERGFGIEKLANGGGQVYRLDNPDDRIKPSAISQQLSVGKIEKRLGADYKPMDEIDKQKIRLGNNFGRAFADKKKSLAKAMEQFNQGGEGIEAISQLRDNIAENPEQYGQIKSEEAVKDLVSQYEKRLSDIGKAQGQSTESQQANSQQQEPKQESKSEPMNIVEAIKGTGNEVEDALYNANSWEDLNKTLADHGFGIVKLDNGGGQIYELNNPHETVVKMSAIGDQLSMGRIEERLGPFDNEGRGAMDLDLQMEYNERLMPTRPSRYTGEVSDEDISEPAKEVEKQSVEPKELSREEQLRLKLQELQKQASEYHSAEELTNRIGEKANTLQRMQDIAGEQWKSIQKITDRINPYYTNPEQARDRLLEFMRREDDWQEFVDAKARTPETFGELKPGADQGRARDAIWVCSDRDLPRVTRYVKQTEGFPHLFGLKREIVDLKADQQKVQGIAKEIEEVRFKLLQEKTDLTSDEEIAQKISEYMKANEVLKRLNKKELDQGIYKVRKRINKVRELREAETSASVKATRHLRKAYKDPSGAVAKVTRFGKNRDKIVIAKKLEEQPEYFGALKGKSGRLLGDNNARTQAKQQISGAIKEYKALSRCQKELDSRKTRDELEKEIADIKQKMSSIKEVRAQNEKMKMQALDFLKNKIGDIYQHHKQSDEVEAKESVRKMKQSIQQIAQAFGLANPAKKVLSKLAAEVGKAILGGRGQGH